MVNRSKGVPLDRTYGSLMTFVPNQTVPFKLDTNSLVEELSVQVTGALTLANYTAPPTIRAEGLENLFPLIQFVGNAKTSGNPTVNFSATDAAFLRLKTMIVEGTAPDRTNVGSANGSYAFQTTFSKYFGVKRIKGIGDASYLDTRNLQALSMNFTCADVSRLVKPGSGTAGTATLGAVTATVHSIEWNGGAPVTNAPYVSETQRKFDLTNLQGLQVPFKNVPLGGILLRQYFKGTVGDSDYEDPSDAFFTTSLRAEGAHVQTIVNGTALKLDTTYAHLQSEDRKTFSLEDWPEGYAVYEYSRTGYLADALNLVFNSKTNPVTSCDNRLDITPVDGSVNTLQITDERLIGS